MTWQKKIIQRLNLNGPFLYIINDPDGLCFEPTILKSLQQADVCLLDNPDPFDLRLSYEQWIKDKAGRALLIRLTELESHFIPYDIDDSAKSIDFHLSEICQNIDTSVLRTVSSFHYQFIIDALITYRPGKLNQQASQDFLLRHLYCIAPEIIKSHTDVVRLLIRKHYIGIEMPVQIEQRLINLLSINPNLKAWDFACLIPNKPFFFDFLQEQWQLYINSLTQSEISDYKWPTGELIVPFDDSDIKVFIDNLFAEGVLIKIENENIPPNHWAIVGVVRDQDYDNVERVKKLLNTIRFNISNFDISTTQPDFWHEQSHSLGILNATFYEIKLEGNRSSLEEEIALLNDKVDQLFEEWLLENFSRLLTLPTVRYPAMVHKVPDWIYRKIEKGNKVCLLVFDGLGARQWPLLRSKIQKINNISIDEHSCFAWVPTITSISRQALFSGKRPFSFSESLLTTHKEEQLWKNFWQDKDLSKREIIYAKKAEKINDSEWEKLFSSSLTKVAGVVINFIDDQMHGVKSGMRGLNVLVNDWLTGWNINKKIECLIDQGFEVIITADHGSQESIGRGIVSQGVTAETKGERVRIYRSSTLRDNTAANMGDSVISWPGPRLGLPQDIFPLLAKGKNAFKNKGELIVGHGGISLHEVVVPFVILNRKQ